MKSDLKVSSSLRSRRNMRKSGYTGAVFAWKDLRICISIDNLAHFKTYSVLMNSVPVKVVVLNLGCIDLLAAYFPQTDIQRGAGVFLMWYSSLLGMNTRLNEITAYGDQHVAQLSSSCAIFILRTLFCFAFIYFSFSAA